MVNARRCDFDLLETKPLMMASERTTDLHEFFCQLARV